jgi:ELWxxDGT repeat protein
MKKGILFTAALAALAPLAIVAGSAQAATDFTPKLVYTFNDEGDDSYAADEIVSFGNKVAIQLDNDELWVSDGTEAGTKSLEAQMATAKVTDYDLERNFSGSESLDIDGVLYFFGTYDNNTDEIFKTNGTTVTRVTTGLGAWDRMHYIDGKIYAFDNNGAFQVNPSTGVFDEFYPEFDCVNAGSTQVQEVGGKIVFIGDDNNCNERLYTWDPATPLVDPVVITSSIGGLGETGVDDQDYMDDDENTHTMFNGEMYFTAEGNIAGENIGEELFKTDGTQAGTVLVKDLFAGLDESGAPDDSYMGPTIIGDEMFFSDTDGDMWKTDGTSSGTVVAIDNSSLRDVGDYIETPAVVLNGKMITGFYNDDIGDALYSTDGTVAGTELLVDTNVTDNYTLCFSYCVELTTFQDHVFFIAYDETSNNVWVTDGTSAGTNQVSTFAADAAVGGWMEASLVVAGDNLFFTVSDYLVDGGTGEMALYKIGTGEELATTGAELNANSLGGLVAMVLVALAGAAVIARRRITTA